MKKIIILMSFLLKLFAERKYDVNLKYFQNDYHVVQEWFEVVSYDKKYVKYLVANIFKLTRNVSAINLTMTFNVDLGNRLEMIGQTYKFASNEYREFPMRMQVNFCQGIEEDFAGAGKFLKCGNFTGCPLVKGRKYHICNWAIDEKKLPPFIPSGRYMLKSHAMYNATELFITKIYFAITRPEV